MSTQTVVMVDISTVTEQLDMMLANQITATEALGFGVGILIVGLMVLTGIFWIGLKVK